MPLQTNSDFLPGIYPLILSIDPPQKGKDNLGIGVTQHGETFLVKDGGHVGVAEFIGAKVCDACGIPACQPTVVTIDKWGRQHQVFGSRMESGEHKFDHTDIQEWKRVTSNCLNTNAFSAMLAVDLVLGNYDRHWDNWLVQNTTNTQGQSCFRLRALDFSRSWPTQNPPYLPLQQMGSSTWKSTQDWGLLGVDFDHNTFKTTCATIATLNGKWLKKQVLQPLSGTFLTPLELEQYCLWWDQHLQNQVIEAIFSLENGVRL